MNMKMVVLAFLLSLSFCDAKCVGKFVNPMTDICWKCIFPIRIAGVQVVKGVNGDAKTSKKPICGCGVQDGASVDFTGVPISFWEPVRLVDVTREPYCLVSMGGISVAKSGVFKRGDVDIDPDTGTKKSFYQVHWYMYPLIYWLEIFLDFICLDKAQIDVGYMTEFDPLWNSDQKATILAPEAYLFGNVLAQGACVADCVATTARRQATDAFFWCNGCQGSLYPFSGTVDHHTGGVQASLLIVGRFMAKLHREFLLNGTVGEKAWCGKYLAPVILKSQYRLQMTYPTPDTKNCWPLGYTEVVWQAGREFPFKGSDFGYLVWRKRDCCLPLIMGVKLA